jgi:hypothetical protein
MTDPRNEIADLLASRLDSWIDDTMTLVMDSYGRSMVRPAAIQVAALLLAKGHNCTLALFPDRSHRDICAMILELANAKRERNG